jgi:hypothetical protein
MWATKRPLTAAAAAIALVLPFGASNALAAPSANQRLDALLVFADDQPAPPPSDPAAPILVDRRCLTGPVICVDKTTRVLRFIRNGRIMLTVAVRFGSRGQPTREGAFRVFRKDQHHVSSQFRGLPMPYSLFFSRGEAVHYSPDFARVGYQGHSHGCVETRDRMATAELFAMTRIGDKLVVYRGPRPTPTTVAPAPVPLPPNGPGVTASSAVHRHL